MAQLPLRSTEASASRPIATAKKHAILEHPSSLVTLFVGNSQERFVVHKDFACHHCPVFAAAFNGPFIEGLTREYRIQDTTEAAVHLLVNWLYTQNLDVLEVSADVPFDEEFTNAIQALVELWVLADKLLIRRLQNDAMRQIQALSDKFAVLATKCLHYVYENTGKDSPLRKVFIYQVAWESELDILEQARKDIPEEMLWDVVAFMIKATSDSGVGYIMMKECKEGGYLVNEDL